MILHSKPTIEQIDEEAILQVLRSSHLEEGSHVRNLEDLFVEVFRYPFANAVSNGFAGIHLSLKAINIQPADEIILPSYTCAALLNPILLLGGIPIIVDVGKNSFNISVDQIENKINKRTKAIIVPHIFGFPAKINEIIRFGIPVIEDCAQSLGGSIKGKKLGTFGQLSVFSFYATKMIASGDGGMIITNNEDYDDVIKNYRYYGHKKLHRFVAFNYHLTNLPAALALSQMMRLDAFVARRKEIAQKYDELLRNVKNIHVVFDGKEDTIYYRYPVQIESNIGKVRTAMKEKGIQCGYGVLEGMHQMMRLPTNEFPNTEKLLKSILSLPIYPSLADASVTYIAHSLKEILKEVK